MPISILIATSGFEVGHRLQFFIWYYQQRTFCGWGDEL